ncbi:putative ribosome biogenesis protein RLP24-like [Trifolium pratense]|nr:putative ribosome biogenesis protein RLP24-like [Trifolium pratense]
MKRNPRKVKWTKAYRRVHGKDMTQDSTFEFERKRNRPERYDRNLAENVLKAIPKIDKIRVSREESHHKNRMKGNKDKARREAQKELKQDIVLITEPNSTPGDKITVNVTQQLPEENPLMEE